MDTSKREIAATAARLVVEEGLEYGPAKRRALRDLHLAIGDAALRQAVEHAAARRRLAMRRQGIEGAVAAPHHHRRARHRGDKIGIAVRLHRLEQGEGKQQHQHITGDDRRPAPDLVR